MSIIYLNIFWRFILTRCFSCDWKLDRYRYPNAPQSMSIEFHRIEGLRFVLGSSRCPSIEMAVMVIDTNQKKDDDDGALVRKRGSMTQQHVASAMESARPNPQRPAGRLLF